MKIKRLFTLALLFIFSLAVSCESSDSQSEATEGSETAPAIAEQAAEVSADTEEPAPAEELMLEQEEATGGAEKPGGPAAERDYLSGRYVETIEIEVINPMPGEEETQELESCLTLRAVDEGALEYSATIFFVGGHSCGFSGTAQMVDHGHYIDSSFDDDAEGCVLEFLIEEDQIRIDDPSGLCQRAFCGARAYLDGSQFDRSSRDRDGKIPCDTF